MQLSGTVNIKASRQKVWEFLTDPNQVAQCAPGVESVEVVEPGRKFRAIAAIGFGTVKARFNGDAEFVELDAPNRAKIKAHGNAPGSAADVASEMFLSDGPDGTTEMRWTADITVLGQLASLAARMMTPVSQKLSEQFFAAAKKKIEG
jgi:carbon monoxide dehydrogenase subunit G